MTDKQIIIDGIDVSGCIYYEDGKCLNGEIVQCNCKKVAICYYKEYKRKEQECKEWKDLANHNGRVCNERLDKIDELEHNINELNEQLEAYKMEAEEGKEINAELKAENDELKKCYKNNSALLDFEETNTTKLVNKVMKLEKTLTEIKEIAEVLITITDEYDNCYHKSECDKCLLGINGDCQYIKVEQILQKISECEVMDE